MGSFKQRLTSAGEITNITASSVVHGVYESWSIYIGEECSPKAVPPYACDLENPSPHRFSCIMAFLHPFQDLCRDKPFWDQK